MYTYFDIGCYADGSFGHDHVRETLANMLEKIHRHHPRGGDGLNWESVKDVVEALRGEMSDDAWEEYEGIEWLDYACYDDVYFTFQDGDLVLTHEDVENGSNESDDFYTEHTK